MATKVIYNVGDLIYIPLPNKCGVVGKVLYISKRNKRVIMIGVFEGYSESLSEVVPDQYKFEKDFAFPPFFTSAELIQKGEWKIIGSDDVTNIDRNTTLRIYAGGVWCGDEMLRRATKEDYSQIPREAVKGIKMVYSLIEKHTIKGVQLKGSEPFN